MLILVKFYSLSSNLKNIKLRKNGNKKQFCVNHMKIQWFWAIEQVELSPKITLSPKLIKNICYLMRIDQEYIGVMHKNMSFILN